MKLKNITFIFENCESFTIDGRYIGDLIIDDIHRCISKVASNSIMKIDTANEFAIEIHRNANGMYCPFECNPMEYPENVTTIFNRLMKHQDIVDVQFTLTDDASEEQYEYRLLWDGESDYTNAYQKAYLSKNLNLYIVVSKTKTIDEYFSYSVIDNPSLMSWHFDMMCDAGCR